MDLNTRIESTEKDCAILGNYFHNVVSDMKSTTPVWDDFLNKGTKLHGLLRTTTTAITAFLDSLQKIADVVTQSKGATKDIGSILTRLCVRQKMMESKLKQFTNVMLECLLVPLQEKLDEWKKSSVQLEKDHAKEYKRATNEIKKKSNDTMRLQKKFRKGSKSDVHYQLNSMMQDVNDKFILLGEGEKSAVKNLLIEERSRACFLSSCLNPVLDVEVSMLNEVSHLQELLTDLTRMSRDPKQLPSNAEQLLTDLLNGNQDIGNLLISPSASSGHLSLHNHHTPPSSPNSTDSRKSSMCSLNSCDSRSSSSQSHNSGSFPYHHANKSTNHTQQSTSRLMSISSHDSGFGSSIAPEMNGRSKPTSPTNKFNHQNSMGEIGSEPISPVIKSNRSLSMPGENVLPTKMQLNKKHYQHNQYNTQNQDLLPSKPAFEQSSPKSLNEGSNSNTQNLGYGICDSGFFTPPPPSEDPQPLPPSWIDDDLPPPPPEVLNNAVTTELPPPPNQDYNKDAKNNHAVTPIVNQNNGSDDVETLRQNFARHSTSPQYNHNSVVLGFRSSPSSGEFLTTMTLGRKNSNNSLQYSSGYSSQHSTPACSEDTIASHDNDFSSTDGDEIHTHDMREFERWSTLPRPRHQPQKSSQRAPRPASTAGFPNGYVASGPTVITTPGTATIKRKPSSKFSSVGRKMSTPMPVAPPTAPSVIATPPPSNHYNANPNKPHLPIKRHQSEGMFVGVSSYYYNNNNSLKSRKNHINGIGHFGSTEEAPPPLPPRDNSR